MDNNYIATEDGGISISEDVIATIVSVAAKEVDGVSDLYARMPVELGKKGIKINKPSTKGITIALADDTVDISLDISVKYGVKLPEVATAVQEGVFHAVETMTSLKVRKVTVNIMSVSAVPAEN